MRKLVPNFILEKYRAGEMRGSLQAAGLFVDLSGFSKMADALARHGHHGAETLTEVMRLVFEPLVGAVYSQDGFVVGYAGDAFIAIFPAHPAQSPAAMRCLSAASVMQAHVKSNAEIQTRFGNFPLSIKVGLGDGETTWQMFTSEDRTRATFCIRGECVRNAVKAEEHAHPGQIIAHERFFETIRNAVAPQVSLSGKETCGVTAARVDDCYQLLSIDSVLPAPRLISDPEPDSAIIRIFAPEQILRLPIVGEFRQVVNLFIDIPAGISDEELMAPFMKTVYALQKRYGGYFLRPELGDKGFNLLMFWGAPTAHETDIVRAINFMLELVERTKLDYRAGLTYRTAYSGFMGVDLREDYTAYGWGVNIAARLMEHSGRNEIWMDEEIARRAEKYFEISPRGEFNFKGFEHKLKAYVLVGRKAVSETVYMGELVGRRAELEILHSFIEPLREGKFAGAMVVQGDAGIGKSRLLHTFQTSVESPVGWAMGQSDEILRQSFSPFRNWLEKRFGFEQGQSNETNLNSLMTRLQKLIDATPDPDLAAELTRTSSVLAALLNLTQENSLYQQLDAKGRYENTLIALSALLRAESLQKPLILFIEDLHWLDEDTRAFLSYLVRTVLAEPGKTYPLAIIGTQRLDAKPLDIGNEAYQFQVKLGALTSSDLSQIAENILGHPVRMELLEILFQRSDGNPFFAEQILHYLVDNNLLFLGVDGFFETKSDTADALPTDVNALLIARLDSLAEDVRETVQTASVLGREFEVRLLAEMLRGDQNIAEKVADAEKHGIWVALDEIQYIFRHALLRDAAYSMQLLARQRQLHEIALTAMETLYAAELENHYGELAFHAERTQLTEKAIQYLTLAGKQAASRYQNALAVEYFTRALALVPDADLQTQYDLIYERAVVYQNTSNRSLQLQDIGALDGFSAKLQDPIKTAKAMYLRSYYLVTMGDHAGGYEISKQVIDQSLKFGDDETALDAYSIMGSSLWRMSRLEEAMRIVEDGLLLAHQLGKHAVESKLLSGMGLIALEQGEHALALESFQEALKIARELKNRRLESAALRNLSLAVVAVHGDYSSAREYYLQAYVIDHESGDRYAEGGILGNIGWLASLSGDFFSARKYLEQALIINREVGSLYQELTGLINLSSLLCMMGDATLALKYASDGYEICQKTHDRSGEGWVFLNMGHAYLLMGKLDEAVKSYERCRVIREELNQPNLAAEAIAGLVQIALQTDNLPTMWTWSEKIYSQIENGNTFAGADDPLRVYYACYQAFEKIRDPRFKFVLRKALQLLEAQVSKLQNETERRMYIENVPWRYAIFHTGQALKISSDRPTAKHQSQDRPRST